METIHPGGWFPAGRPLPPSAAPVRGDSPASRAAEAEREAASSVADFDRDPLEGAAVLRGRMAWSEALELARRAAAEDREARDTARYAEAMNEQACIHLLAGNLGRAEEACGLSPGQGSPPEQRARTLVNYAVLAGLGGDAGEALARLDEAAALVGRGDSWERLLVGANRAQALGLRAERDAAERAAADALRLARRVRTHEEWLALGQMAAGLAGLARGRRNDARARLGEAVRGFARVGDGLRQVQCHYLLGEIAYGGEDPIRAGGHYRDGLGVARGAGAQEAIELLTLRFEHR